MQHERCVQRLNELFVDSLSERQVIEVMVLIGDIARLRMGTLPTVAEDWKRSVAAEVIHGAMRRIVEPSPDGLLVRPEEVRGADDLVIPLIQRDKFHSFVIALNRIRSHRAGLLRGSYVEELDREQQSLDTWLSAQIHEFKLSPLQIEVMRGDRVLVEKQPAWVSHVMIMMRPQVSETKGCHE